MLKNIMIWIILSGFLFGCSSAGFNRGKLKQQIGVTQFQISDEQIKEVLNRKANLPKPFKLGIYFKTASVDKTPQVEGYPQKKKESKWKWQDKDREVISKVFESYQKSKMISKVVYLSSDIVADTNNLQAIRLAGAQYGVDAVLIINGIAEIDRYINKAGWSYALLLPTLFIPGSEVDALFMANASLWDVKNGFLYLTAESEGKYHEQYIAIRANKDSDVIDHAKAEAIEKLGKNILEMIEGK